MTQVPYPNLRPTEPTPAAGSGLDFFDRTTTDPFGEVFLDESGAATFERPASNYFQVIGNKIYRDQTASDSFNFFQKAVARSGAEWIASANEKELTAPIAESDGILITEQGEVPITQASAKQAFLTIPEPERLALRQMGITEESLTHMGIHSAEDLQDQWTTLVHLQRAHQLIDDFNERSSLITRASNTALTFGTNVITDPGVILTLGYGAFAKSTVREGGKRAALQQTARSVAEDGVFPTVLRGSLLSEKVTAARVLNALAYGTANATIAESLSRGDYVASVGAGIVDPSQGYDPSVSGILLSGSLGALFGDFAMRSAGMKAKTHTRASYRAYTGDDGFGLTHYFMEHQEQLGRSNPEELFQSVDIESVEAVYEAMNYLYNSVELRHLSDFMAEYEHLGEADYGNIFRYLWNNPTMDELEDYLLRKGWESSEHVDTAFTRLSKEITDLSIKERELSKGGTSSAVRDIRTRLELLKSEKQEILDDMLNRNRQSEVYSEFRERESSQSRIRDLPTQAEREARIAQIIDRASSKAARTNKGRLIPGLRKAAIKTNNVLDDLAGAKNDIHYGDELTSVVARHQGLIDDNKHSVDELFTDANGERISSVYSEHQSYYGRHYLPIRLGLDSLYKGRTPEEAHEISLRIQRARNSGDASGLTGDEKKILDMYSKAVDEMGARGIEATTLDNLIPNYITTTVERHATPEQTEMFEVAFLNRMRTAFDPDNTQSPVNYNALVDMGHGKWEGKKFVPKGEVLTEVPKTVGDLPESIRADYGFSLENSLILDAREAITKYLGRHEEMLDNPAIIKEKIRTNPNPTAMRKIEQDFLLSDEVVDTAIFNYDIGDGLNKYMNGVGYNIMLDERLGLLLGEPVRHQEYFNALRKATNNNDRAQSALKRLERVNKRASGRVRIDDNMAVASTAIQDVVSAGVSSTIGQTIIQTEASGSILRMMGGASRVSSLVQQFAFALSNLPKDRAKRLMTLLENENNRFVGNTNHYLTEEARDSKLLFWTGTLNKASRIVSLERFLTTLSKNMNYATTFSKVDRYRKKLDKLVSAGEEMDEWSNDIPPKTLRDIARRNGIREGDLLLFRSHGLLKKSSVDTMKQLMEADKEALVTLTNFRRASDSLDPSSAAAARELEKKFSTMALQDANTFVATPTPNTQVTTDHSFTTLILGFTSFQRAFAEGAVSRASLAPAWKQMAGFGFLLGATLSSKIARDILYNGESPDTIAERWEDDPVREMAFVLREVPLLGPYNLVPHILMGAGMGSRYGLEGVLDAPAFGILGRQMDAARSVVRSATEGDDVSDSAMRTFNRTVPPFNMWYAQILREMQEGFEADGDR